MADNTISDRELKKLMREGAEVDFGTEVMKIEQFGDLVAALKTLTSNESERIRADIARNQTNIEILATLQALIKKPVKGMTAPAIDLTPLKDILEDIRAERDYRAKVGYNFEIKRDGRGFASSIEALPIQPTLN